MTYIKFIISNYKALLKDSLNENRGKLIKWSNLRSSTTNKLVNGLFIFVTLTINFKHFKDIESVSILPPSLHHTIKMKFLIIFVILAMKVLSVLSGGSSWYSPPPLEKPSDCPITQCPCGYIVNCQCFNNYTCNEGEVYDYLRCGCVLITPETLREALWWENMTFIDFLKTFDLFTGATWLFLLTNHWKYLQNCSKLLDLYEIFLNNQ